MCFYIFINTTGINLKISINHIKHRLTFGVRPSEQVGIMMDRGEKINLKLKMANKLWEMIPCHATFNLRKITYEILILHFHDQAFPY